MESSEGQRTVVIGRSRYQASDDVATRDSGAARLPKMIQEICSTSDVKVWEPTHGPRQVLNRFHISKVYEVNDLEQHFKVDFEMVQEWMLSSTEKDDWAGGTGGKSDDQVCGWTPAIPTLINAVDQDITPDKVTVVRWANMLTAMRKVRIVALLTEAFELRSFPFDTQDFTIKMRFSTPDTEANFLPDLKRPAFITVPDGALTSSQWRLAEPMCQIRKHPVAGLNAAFEQIVTSQWEIVIFLKARRNASSYVLRIGLLLLLISMSALFSFAIFAEEGPGADELAHGATCMLSALAFQYVISTLLPVLGYLTILDWYAMLNIGFIFFVMGCNMSLRVIELEDKAEANRSLALLAVLLLAGLNLTFLLIVKLASLPAERAKLAATPADGGGAGEDDCRMYETICSMAYSRKCGDTIYYGKTSALFKQEASELAGVYWSPDYSSASRLNETEFMQVSIRHSEDEPARLNITKITGDENVAAGKVTVAAEGVPVVGGGAVPASIALALPGGQGLSMQAGEGLTAVSKDHLVFRFGGKSLNYYRHVKEVDPRK